jgi:hypothetical protein
MIEQYKHERDRLFDVAFDKQFGRIEDYRFRGFNHALGCFVESKAHYKRLMKQKGLIPADAAEELAEEVKSRADRTKNLALSHESESIIHAIRQSPRKKDGTIELSGRLIEAMVNIGAIGNDSDHEPIGARTGG